MAKEEKSIDLHLVHPMIYKLDDYLGLVLKIEVFYTDELELVSHNGNIYTPCVELGKREHENLLVQVRETEEEIRAMVDGELKLVEFKEESDMDDSKKAIQNIKQALRQLATNGVPVGNMIEAMKEIEEKYAESEDEKIRKDIVFYIAANHKDDAEKAHWLYWLEKQGEQKPEWSEEDSKWAEEIRIALRFYSEDKAVIERLTNWFDNHIRPKPEWSEEDEKHIKSLLARLDGMCKKDATFIRTRFAVSEDKDWLKSLRPQKQWKPTEEQMNELKYAYIDKPYSSEVLETLYDDLKKLMEE